MNNQNCIDHLLKMVEEFQNRASEFYELVMLATEKSVVLRISIKDDNGTAKYTDGVITLKVPIPEESNIR